MTTQTWEGPDPHHRARPTTPENTAAAARRSPASRSHRTGATDGTGPDDRTRRPDVEDPAQPWRVVGVSRWSALLRDSSLPTPTKLVGLLLGTYSTGDTGRDVRPGLALLAAVADRSERYVSDVLDVLRAAGWVRRVRCGSDYGERADEYVLTIPPGYVPRTADELRAAHAARPKGRGGRKPGTDREVPEADLTRTGVPVGSGADPNWSSGQEEGLTRTGVPVRGGPDPNWSSDLTRTGVRPTSSVPPQKEQQQRTADAGAATEPGPLAVDSTDDGPAADDSTAHLLALLAASPNRSTTDSEPRRQLRTGERVAIRVRDLGDTAPPATGRCPTCGAGVRTRDPECWPCEQAGRQQPEPGDVIVIVRPHREPVDAEAEAARLVSEHVAACRSDHRKNLTREGLAAVERHTRAALETYPPSQVRAGLASARAGRWLSLDAAARQLPELIAEAPADAPAPGRRKLEPWEM